MPNASKYDVFLSHDSVDKPVVLKDKQEATG